MKYQRKTIQASKYKKRLRQAKFLRLGFMTCFLVSIMFRRAIGCIGICVDDKCLI